MEWAGNVTLCGHRGSYRAWGVGDLIERGHLEVLDVDGRIILKSVFKKYNGLCLD
jgi:hypothetical protein